MSKLIRAISMWVFCFFFLGVPYSKADWIQDDGVAICTAEDTQGGPAIISDGAGGAIMVWQDTRNDTCFVYAQRVDRSGVVQWANNGVRIGKSIYCGWGGTLPQITSDGEGGAIVTWVYPPSYLYAQRLNASGVPQWTTRLLSASTNQEWSQITSDGQGGAIVAWGDQTIYAQRVNASGTREWGLYGVTVTTTGSLWSHKCMASDGMGGAIVSWRGVTGSGFRIFAQRLNASGIAQWTAGGVPLSPENASAALPRVVSDGAGGGIIVWQKTDPYNPDIYAQRLSAFGIPLWAPGGVAICTEPHEQEYPVIASDGALGAIIAWEDSRSDPSRVYAQRVNASGSIKWALNGVALCASGGWPRSTSDGMGGAIIAYLGDRNYAQRLDSLGSVLWPGAGTVLSTVTSGTEYEIISDGESGAIVTWAGYDGVNFAFHIYAQRVDGAGHTGVATLLQNFGATFFEAKIILNWTLSEIDTDVNFFVLRSSGPSESFIELSLDALSREGLSFSFVDRNWEPGTSYYYRVEYSYLCERKTLFETGPIVTPNMPLTLYQNFPNPFNPSTTIRFSLLQREHVRLEIFDVAGRVVRCLVDGPMNAGWNEARWDGKDNAGKAMASGMYFYRLCVGKEREAKKMILLR